MSLRMGCWVTPRIAWNSARAADGLECESTTTTPSLVRITAAFEFTLYWGAAIAAYTPSATGLSSKRSLVTLLPSAGKTQQGSRCMPCVLIRYPPCGETLVAMPALIPVMCEQASAIVRARGGGRQPDQRTCITSTAVAYAAQLQSPHV